MQSKNYLQKIHRLLKQCNSTFLTFIPKIQEAKDYKDYRPIILCNVGYNIITKVLVERLKPILPEIISHEQDGFVKGKQIIDGIIWMHEFFTLKLQQKKNQP